MMKPNCIAETFITLVDLDVNNRPIMTDTNDMPLSQTVSSWVRPCRYYMNASRRFVFSVLVQGNMLRALAYICFHVTIVKCYIIYNSHMVLDKRFLL